MGDLLKSNPLVHELARFSEVTTVVKPIEALIKLVFNDSALLRLRAFHEGGVVVVRVQQVSEAVEISL